VAIGLPVDLQ